MTSSRTTTFLCVIATMVSALAFYTASEDSIEKHRLALAAVVGGSEVPALSKGPCGPWKSCTSYYNEQDKCGGHEWTQGSPCPLTRNCAFLGNNCEINSATVFLNYCANTNALDCAQGDKNCGTVLAGKCNVTETQDDPGTYRCEGGECDTQGSGTLNCPDWDKHCTS